jgi:hypothetical protein
MADREVRLIITSDATRAIAGMKQLEAQTGSFMSRLKGSWLEFAAVTAGASIAFSKAVDLMSIGAKALQAEEAFRNTAASYKVNADQMIVNLKRITNETIDDSDLVQQAMKMMSGGVPEQDIMRTAEIARTASRRMGEDIQVSFENIGDAILTGKTKILKAYSLLTAEDQKWVDAAKAAGHEVDIMTGILANYTIQQEAMGKSIENTVERIQQMKTAFNEMGEEAGKVGINFSGFFGSIATGFAATIFRPLAELERLQNLIPGMGKLGISTVWQDQEKKYSDWSKKLRGERLPEEIMGYEAGPYFGLDKVKRDKQAWLNDLKRKANSKNAADGLATLARAQADWAKRIEQMDPLLDEETRKLEGFYDAIEMTRMALAKDKLPTSWLDTILSKGEGLIKLAQGLKEVQLTNEALAKWEEDKAADTFARTLLGADQGRRMSDLSTTRQANLLALRSRTGDLSPRDVTEQGFALDRQSLETASRRLTIETDTRKISALSKDDFRTILGLENERLALKQQILDLDELSAASLAQYSRTLEEGLLAGLKMYTDDLSRHFEYGVELARNAAQEMERGFSDLFFDAMTGQLKTAEDYFRAFLNSIARMMSDLIARDLMTQIVGGSKGGGFGGLLGMGLSFFGASPALTGIPAASTGAPYIADAWSAGVYGWHTGGPVRLHAGGFPLNADEVPAILQMDEYVIRRDAARRIGTSTLDALNRGQSPGNTTSTSLSVGPIVINGEVSRALEVRLRHEFENTARRVLKEAM